MRTDDEGHAIWSPPYEVIWYHPDRLVDGKDHHAIRFNSEADLNLATRAKFRPDFTCTDDTYDRMLKGVTTSLSPVTRLWIYVHPTVPVPSLCWEYTEEAARKNYAALAGEG